MNNPLISIITVSYNAVQTIEQTILSVINQTYENIEYIIIDGDSTDGTVDIIKKYADKIAYWVSEPDKGIYDAMNKGISLSHGDYLNFMNAGDYFFNTSTISNISKKIDNYDYITGIAVYPNGKLWKPIKSSFTFKDVFKGGGVNHQASFIKKSLLTDGYDCRYTIISDELLFLKKIVLQGFSYKSINQNICYYDNTGISNSPEAINKIREERKMFYQENIPNRILADYIYLTREIFPIKVYRKIKHLIRITFKK